MTVRILLVEDEMIVALDLQQRLEALQYQVVGPAVTGSEAVRLQQALAPDLILMDIKLRGPMDGVQAATRIRAGSAVPIIFLTASADAATLLQARQVGPADFLDKPFESSTLSAAIARALNTRTGGTP
jgi:CheY-like chemotaxis protein